MQLVKSIALAGLVAFGSGAGAFAETVYTKGIVKNAKPEDSKVTIIHEELVELDMPAMTMVFRVADDAMFERLEPGAEIEFSVERINGKLTVTGLR